MLRHPHLSVLAFIGGTLATAGCADVPSEDDPRDTTTYSESEDDHVDVGGGRCTGSPVSCEYRAVSQCNAGCETELMCNSVVMGMCPLLRDQASCNDNSWCTWSSTSLCMVAIGTTCNYYYNELDCNAESDCVWGSGCDGYPDWCSAADDQTICSSTLGCSWKTE
ncbi:MAG: hypothetical protein AB7L28_17025 [Kofleriaceae bacterium]